MTLHRTLDPCPRLVLVCALLLTQACAQGETPCRVGADCRSGICLVDGTCQPPADGSVDAEPADAGSPDAGALDAGPSDDGGGDAGVEDAAARDAGPLDAGADGGGGCGNGDGVLTRAELPLPLAVAIVRRVAFDASVDTAGATRADGSRLWDFEGPFPGDADRTDQRVAVDGQWFAPEFPGATYVLPLSADDDLLGVFASTGEALLLVGVVSPESGALRTELTYDPPAPVWRFPLALEASWEATSSVRGRLHGAITAYSETWSVEVDAAGDLGTPAGVRPVLRVNTALTRTVGLAVTRTRRHAYVEECVGTVAQVFSADGDTSAEPSFAAELWRVAP